MVRHLILLLICNLFSLNQGIQCPPGPSDAWLEDPENCQNFYRCTSGQKFKFTCGPGTVYNPENYNCDWPHAVHCPSRYPNSRGKDCCLQPFTYEELIEFGLENLQANNVRNTVDQPSSVPNRFEAGGINNGQSTPRPQSQDHLNGQDQSQWNPSYDSNYPENRNQWEPKLDSEQPRRKLPSDERPQWKPPASPEGQSQNQQNPWQVENTRDSLIPESQPWEPNYDGQQQPQNANRRDPNQINPKKEPESRSPYPIRGSSPYQSSYPDLNPSQTRPSNSRYPASREDSQPWNSNDQIGIGKNSETNQPNRPTSSNEGQFNKQYSPNNRGNPFQNWKQKPTARSGEIEPSPQLARGPERQRPTLDNTDHDNQSFPTNQRNNPKNRDTPRWNEPRQSSTPYSQNQPEPESRQYQQLKPNKQSKATGKLDPESDERTTNRDRYKGANNERNKNNWPSQRSSTPSYDNNEQQPDESEDPASKTQWYRPPFSQKSQDVDPGQEEAQPQWSASKKGDNRPENQQKPIGSTSPYYNQRPTQPRTNPSPRPVYDRRQGNLKPSNDDVVDQRKDRWSQPQSSNEQQQKPYQQRPQSFTPQNARNSWNKPTQDAHDNPEQQKEDLTFDSSEIEPRFPEETEVAAAVNDIHEKDPYSIPDLMSHLPCNETNLSKEECKKCEKLEWLKFNQVTLKTKVNETLKSSPEYIAVDCFRRCARQGCVAYSYVQDQGQCKLFYGPVSVDDVEADESAVTVIKEPSSSLLADEWLYTAASQPSGRELGTFNAESSMDCLRGCVTVTSCKAISYDPESKLCRIYDSVNGERLNLVGGGIATWQHRSIHSKGTSWRFTSMGFKKLNSSLPLGSFAVRESEECFEECLATPGCLALSLEGQGSPIECHLYSQLSELTDDESQTTYLMSIPLNSSQFLELPGLYFSGKPLAKYDSVSLSDCHDAAKSTPDALKITFLKETGSCYIFSDAAKIGVWKNPEIEASAYLVNLAQNWTYTAYKRLPGLTLTNALIAPTGEKLTDSKSALPCLEKCLESNCTAVSVTYSDSEDSIECVFLKEEELLKTPKFVFKEDTDLFVRLLPSSLLPNSQKSDHCSYRLNVPSSNDNLPYFEKEKSKSPSLEEKLERLVESVNPFHKKRPATTNPAKATWETEEEELMSPHGLEFEGMIEDNLSQNEGESSYYDDRSNAKRNKRSTYAMTLRGAQVYGEALDGNDKKIDPLEAGSQAGLAVRQLLTGPLRSSDNSTQDILLRRFLKRVQDRTSRPRTQDDIVDQMKATARKVRSSDDLSSQDQWVPCKLTKGSVVKESKCRPNEICSRAPSIVHGSEEKLANCTATRVNSTCSVSCQPGYKASQPKITCELIGTTPTWNSKDISCSTDSSACSELPWIVFRSDDSELIDYLIKYDSDRKLPLFAVYKRGSTSNENEVKNDAEVSVNVDDERNVVALPCQQLKSNQLSNAHYKHSNYTKGHLVPPSAFRSSKTAQAKANYFVNTAPQDPFTKQGPWSVLSDKIHDYLNQQPGIVITGICPQQIYQPSTSMLPVPKCFWKTVCTRTESGEVTAATFYHDNTIPETSEEKKLRFEEVLSYTNPEFVRTLMGSKEYDTIWPEILDRFSTSSSKTVSDEMMILQCAGRKTIDPAHIEFWNNLLSNGTAIPTEFSDTDLATSESSDSPRWARSTGMNSNSGSCEKKLIGYIGIDGNEIKKEITDSPLTHLTLLSAIQIQENGTLSPGNDTKAIYNRLYQLKSLKKSKKGLKILIGLGGWLNSEHFSAIARNPVIQKTFIMDVLAFLDYWEFDGVDIIWQYPGSGGKSKGSPADKSNLVRLMKNLRDSFAEHGMASDRDDKAYNLVLTGPGLNWILDQGYDLKALTDSVDWFNIMAFDFHGPWNSSWGDYTGPHAPLYFGAPDGFPGKLNVDSIVKRYACETGRPDKLVLGLGFYGRIWTNVGGHVEETKDDLFRKASPMLNGKKGGLLSYRTLRRDWLVQSEPRWHNETQTSFLWNRMKRALVSFESPESIKAKVQYAADKGLGGLMIWSLDMDDEEKSLLKAVGNGIECSSSSGQNLFKCNPLPGKKIYWTQYDDNGTKDRMCGKRAPLINGSYAVCDPDNPGYSCCSAEGYCGSGPDFCECENCVDYGREPERILEDSVIPTSENVNWLTLDQISDPSKPNCGYSAEKMLQDGQAPGCNPDDPKRHCCSATGFCGTGPDYCECKGCTNFSNNSSSAAFREKNWFDWSDGPENAGRCGPRAPRIKSHVAGCDPSSSQANCCGLNGYCGTGPEYCDCRECVNFTKKPNFDWS